MPPDDQMFDRLAADIARYRSRAEQWVGSYRWRAVWFPWGSLFFGGLATLVSGVSSIVGDPAKDAFGGWRSLCVVVASLSFLGTFLNGWYKMGNFQATTADAALCLSALDALEREIAADAIAPADAIARLNQIATEHRTVLFGGVP